MSEAGTKPAAAARLRGQAVNQGPPQAVVDRLTGRHNGHRRAAVALLDAMATLASEDHVKRLEIDRLRAALEKKTGEVDEVVKLMQGQNQVVERQRAEIADLKAKLDPPGQPAPGLGPQPEIPPAPAPAGAAAMAEPVA